MLCVYHTRLADATGSPAITLPVGLTKDNMPVGFMIMGARFCDEEVLRLGLAYERKYDFISFKS